MNSTAVAKGRILVIEDDADILEILKLMLEGEGHTVTTVDKGAPALEMVEAGRFDMIVMDIAMPQMSGIEIAQALRAAEKGAEIYIAIHTGLAEDWVRERFDDYDLFLAKSDGPDDLVAAIARLLSQPKIPRAKRNATIAEQVFTDDEVVRTRRALWSVVGLDSHTVALPVFLDLLADAISQLRQLGHSDDSIAELISGELGRDFSGTAIANHKAGT